MKNLHNLVKSVANEPISVWILGLLWYAILDRNCNIYSPNQTEVNFPKTTQPYVRHFMQTTDQAHGIKNNYVNVAH